MAKDLLRLLLIALAFYAIPTGLVAIPVGLFIGPHILISALVHLAVGALAAGCFWRMTHKPAN